MSKLLDLSIQYNNNIIFTLKEDFITTTTTKTKTTTTILKRTIHGVTLSVIFHTSRSVVMIVCPMPMNKNVVIKCRELELYILVKSFHNNLYVANSIRRTNGGTL